MDLKNITDPVGFFEDLIRAGAESCRERQKFLKENTKTYIIYDCKSDLYKIGKSIDPQKRLKTISLANDNLTMYAICDRNIENELHQKYKQYKAYKEWFKLDNKQLNEIMSYGFKRIS